MPAPKFVFQATDAAHGLELWASDGTTSGTVLVKDIQPGSAGSGVSHLTSLGNGKVVFQADDGTNGQELWVSDGTELGTVRIDLAPGADPSSPAGFMPLGNGKALFQAIDGSGSFKLWVTDGTQAGTGLVASVTPPTPFGGPADYASIGHGRVVFQAEDGTNGPELWVSDGTAAGTVRLMDINPALSSGSSPANFKSLGNGKVVFAADDGASGTELWITDGTTAGTSLVKDIAGGAGASNPSGFLALGNGKVLFQADDGVGGAELWISDGTNAGTTRVEDINPGAPSSSPSSLTSLGNGKVVFQASTDGSGAEPWVSDGTQAGTVSLGDIRPGATGSDPVSFYALGNGQALFLANDGVHGAELWITDGTASGTSLLKDIEVGSASSNAYEFADLGDGRLLFRATTGAEGEELWITDGTTAGTVRLRDIDSGSGSSSPQYFTAVGAFADRTPPSIASVSIPNVAMKIGDVVTATITVLSDTDVYTLQSGTIGGYALGALTKVNDTTYTATFTVAAGADVASGSDLPVSLVLEDPAGNASTAYTTAISQGGDGIDATRPTLVSSSVDGTKLVLTYSEALDGTHGPAAGDFLVTAGGSAVTVAGVVVDSSAGTVTLTLASPVAHGQTVTVAYTDPTTGNDANAVQDAAGNDAATLAATNVTNTTPAPNPPTPPVTPPTNKLVDGVSVVVATTTDGNGRPVETVTVATVPAARNETDTSTTLADIPLVGKAAAPALVAHLPVGVGLTSTGPTSGLTLGEVASKFESELRHLSLQAPADGTVSAVGLTHLLALSTDAVFRTVTITSANGSKIDTPIVIEGDAATERATAVLIDARQLPEGSVVNLDHIDYAVVVGKVTIGGGAGNNVAIGDMSSQTIVLGTGVDTVRGGDGDDTVGSADGRDLLYGDAGNDRVFGGADYDRMSGGTGNDTIDGGAGVDAVRIEATFADVTIAQGSYGSGAVTNAVLGHDTMTGVEILRFNDRVELMNAPQTSVSTKGTAYFSEAAYLASNPDVAAAVAKGQFQSGLDHFQRFGEAEHRLLTVALDERFYLAQNADVAAAVQRGEFKTGLEHYREFGEREGRDPNALFDSVWYLAHNPDVAAAVKAGAFKDGYQHFQIFGWKEGRDPSAWMDTSGYLAANPDVAKANVNALDHFLDYGVREGRTIQAVDEGYWLS